jgi:glutamate synthase domain-containing protein 2
MLHVLSYGLGSVLGFAVVLALAVAFVRDTTQTRHTVLRNYPVIGRLRYFLERQGEYFRQYFFAGEHDERPFDRATRAWVYREAKGLGGIVGFGSTSDMDRPGSLLFVNAPFPPLEQEYECTPPVVLGSGYCERPFTARSLVNISGMSYGAISAPAVQALSKGAAQAGCWLNTGEGGLSEHHRAGGCDIVMQIGTACYGVRDAHGQFSRARVSELGEFVQAFEIKLSQGAKPGKGGVLPAKKVTEDIARIRGIVPFRDSISPARHPDVPDVDALLDRVALIRGLSGRPVGIKTALGGPELVVELCEAVLRRGLADAPDYIAIDGGEGGSGAAPQSLADHVGLAIAEALPLTIDVLLEAGLKDRIKVVAAGKLVTAAKAAWALAVGADFVATARGFLFSLGCIQAMRCHTNTCPTGITTHNKRLQRGLVVGDKAQRVANYALNMNREIEMIAHACGLRHARQLRREHVRIVQATGRSEALSTLFPYPRRQALKQIL